jgi:nitrite reductase/ring-hydroxylating ferredoxin subunit
MVTGLAAAMLDELGYDPDDGVPDAATVIDVPAGAIVRARDGARAVAIARLASGALVVVDDICPHDGGPISDGFVEGEQLVCARHGWSLDVRAGRCERAPSTCPHRRS